MGEFTLPDMEAVLHRYSFTHDSNLLGYEIWVHKTEPIEIRIPTRGEVRLSNKKQDDWEIAKQEEAASFVNPPQHSGSGAVNLADHLELFYGLNPEP